MTLLTLHAGARAVSYDELRASPRDSDCVS